jgi:DNA polymerase-3 subunit beta
MNFIVSGKTLLQHLLTVNGVISSNNTLPILNDFLFEIKDNELTISGSDLETTISAKMSVEARENGQLAIQAKILIDTLKTLPDQPLTFNYNAENKQLSLSTESGKFKLSCHDAADFPRIPGVQGTGKISVDSTVLAMAIHRTVFATGNDELRPVMSGVFLELGNDKTNFVATDAHKLVRYTRTDVKAEQNASLILPKKPLNVLKNILTAVDADVEVSYNNSHILFNFENITLVSRLIEGKYPNYEAVIPKDNPNVLTVDKTAFLNTIRRVSIFSNKTTHQVRLKIVGSSLSISAEDLDFSNEGFEQLPCSYSGDDMEIGFNSKFLMEMLNNIDSEQVTLNMSAPNRAGILVPADSEDDNEQLMMLVMPIMLNS